MQWVRVHTPGVTVHGPGGRVWVHGATPARHRARLRSLSQLSMQVGAVREGLLLSTSSDRDSRYGGGTDGNGHHADCHLIPFARASSSALPELPPRFSGSSRSSREDAVHDSSRELSVKNDPSLVAQGRARRVEGQGDLEGILRESSGSSRSSCRQPFLPRVKRRTRQDDSTPLELALLSRWKALSSLDETRRDSELEKLSRWKALSSIPSDEGGGVGGACTMPSRGPSLPMLPQEVYGAQYRELERLSCLCSSTDDEIPLEDDPPIDDETHMGDEMPLEGACGSSADDGDNEDSADGSPPLGLANPAVWS